MHVGVVGLGYWGPKHVRVLAGIPAVSRITVYDRDPNRAAPAGTAERAWSFEALLDRVDAVVVATPPSSHAVVALGAMAAGKHVLVEKPMATNSADAMAMAACAEASGVVLMVGHTFAYNPVVTALGRHVERGELGRVTHLHGDRLNLGLFQPDCDVIWDLAPHDLTIARTVFGRPPTTVHAWGSSGIRPNTVDDAYLRLDYGSGGPRAVFHLSWLHPQKVRRITVVGSDRMAVYDDLAPDERLKIYDKGVQAPPAEWSATHPLSYRYGEIRAPFVDVREPLHEQDRHFIDCISAGSEPRTGAAAGIEVVRMLECVSRSLTEGMPIDVAERSGPRASSAQTPPDLILPSDVEALAR